MHILKIHKNLEQFQKYPQPVKWAIHLGQIWFKMTKQTATLDRLVLLELLTNFSVEPSKPAKIIEKFNLRFKSPKPLNPKEGVSYDVSNISDVLCPQFSEDGEGDIVLGQEDCLLLNIYIPEIIFKDVKINR